MKRALFLGAVIFLTWSGLGRAEDVRIAYFTYNPIIYAEGGEVKGAAAEIVRKMADGFSPHFDAEAMPIKRLLTMAESNSFIVAALGRTSEREAHFVWLGQLYCDEIVTATIAPTPRIDTFDQARSLKTVGTGRGAAAEDLLERNGFTNVESSGDMFFEARKLQARRIEGWIYPRLNIQTAWRAIGADPGDLQIGEPLGPLCLWVAASKSMPEKVVEQLRARLQELTQDQTVANEIAAWTR